MELELWSGTVEAFDRSDAVLLAQRMPETRYRLGDMGVAPDGKTFDKGAMWRTCLTYWETKPTLAEGAPLAANREKT